MNHKNKASGFTLTEISITIAILSILAVVGVSSYQNYALKARRAEAMQTIVAIQLAEERYRSENATYGDLTNVWNGTTSTTSGNYTLSITNNTATTYTITATAQGNQTSDVQDGTTCSPISLAIINGNETKSPAACWPG